MAEIDPQTRRRVGDHGRAEDAIDFLLDNSQSPGEESAFLRAWREGSAFKEWPEFYLWLRKQEAKRGHR